MTDATFETTQAHAAPHAAPARPRTTPVYLTAGFEFDEYEQAAAHFGDGIGYSYTRISNPTIDVVEQQLAALEGGADGLLVASGQAALSTTLLGLCSAGDHILSSTHVYEGSRGLIRDQLSRFGIESDFLVDVRDPEAWERLIRPNTRVLFAESVSNASNTVLDIAAIAEVAHRHGIALVIDNTVPTPYLVRPLELGADLVIHSASKFLSGQGSVLGGLVVDAGTFDVERDGKNYPQLLERGRLGGASVAERVGGLARITYMRESVAPRFGPTPSPLNAFLIGQGAETLSLRVRRQSDVALEVARALDAHPAVEGVDHPGLASHPDHELAQRLLPRGAGSVFTFTVRGGAEAARTVVESLRLVTHMTHIGDVRSLVLHPATTSHTFLTPEEQESVGVFPGTLRLSIGIEDAGDLIADLSHALAALEAVPA
ncbi:O-acetylhomoserine aminocarboxypropyltransferase/cysteine synthase [Pseudoclavibacter chungangensis]|uniref:homocysteine desulfhydrase n=1 Tax=Pseudoclavibacter chungangensis TaxID=587635 RepID=A0A7J5C1I0_9MICO|nr:aminotransferase class V-fold PLP-dependent enzyme [Pseudoclavibacter chungangensis]KAB1662353.1 O-acetylhomoserine aminocarboxypropyltransferase/cysteine synthase [Pseudoclavibacter chungangensis]NYJ65564.1 O-acetylhomoserine (thiol)-lyase [Pseudoclavibacter chungangensis]